MPSSLHLASSAKKDETDDVFLVVGLVRAQRDGNRPCSTVQDDIAGGRSIRGFGPTFTETSFYLVQGSRLFLLRFVRRSELLRVAGIGPRTVEGAVLPTT